MKAFIKRALLAGVAFVPLVVPAGSDAYAQTAARNYSIAPQPLDDALRQFAAQSGRDVVFDPKLVAGKRSPGLQGAYGTEAGLRQLISGSDIAVFTTSNGFALRGNAAAEPARVEVPETGAAATAMAPASTVVDERTGAALKGALVEIVGTDEKTSTGDLGEFRFPGRSGIYDIRVSYLGYPPYQQSIQLRDGRATTGILLPDGGSGDVIVVTAYQSGRAQALNQERTAENSKTVISADLLGQFDGTTIADSLRRAPGVAFQPDSQTGEGKNIIVRGLSPEFNTVTLNGLRLPVGNGFDRSPQLNNILTDSISSITINKTLLPNQDGSGTGGLVEVETKGALDRPRRSASIVIEGAKAAKDFLNEFAAAASASARFGASENFGVSMSVQYRKRSIRSLATGASDILYGPYLPGMDGANVVYGPYSIDPRRSFPFEEGVDSIYPVSSGYDESISTVKDLSLVASLQWQIGQHTNLRLDYTKSNQTLDDFNRSVSTSATIGYVLVPVDALGGEVRPVLTSENVYAAGIEIAPFQSAEIRKTSSKTDTISFRGKSSIDKLQLDYKAGFTRGNETSKYSQITSYLSPTFSFIADRTYLQQEALDNEFEGRIVSLFRPLGSGDNTMLLNELAYNLINDASNYAFYGQVSPSNQGFNKRYTAAVDAKYTFDISWIKYLQVGAFWEKSRSYTRPEPATSFYSNGESAADIGFEFDVNPLRLIGRDAGFRVASESFVRDFLLDPSLLDPNNPRVLVFPNPRDELALGEFTEERDLAGYAQAHIQIGKTEIIGGVRVERIKTNARASTGVRIFDENDVWDYPYYLSSLVLNDYVGSQTNILPRLTVNYRPTENIVARLGYYQTIARPSILQLNSNVLFTLFQRPGFGPNFNQPLLSISSGNPDLEPSVTNNFDLSIEYYDSSIGALKLSAFYKPTQKPIFSNSSTLNEVPPDLELPDDPRFQNLPANIAFLYEYPTNSDKNSWLWGLEAAVEKKLGFIAETMKYFGIYANYTYTKSSRRTSLSSVSGQVFIDGVPYGSQPEHSGTLALTYGRGGFDASLAYTWQAKYMTAYQGFGIGQYQDKYDSLDLKAAYQTSLAGKILSITLEASNLLKGPRDPNVSSSIFNSDGSVGGIVNSSYLGGRSFRLGTSVRF